MIKTSSAVLLSALTSALVVSLLLLFAAPNDAPTQQAEQGRTYDEILSSGKIRAAYAVGAPLFMIDPNTNHRGGIFHDIVTTAAQRLGLDVEWVEEVGYGEMIQGLQAGRYDIVGSGIWISPSRARSADFTIPLFYDAVFAYVRSDAAVDPTFLQDRYPNFTISTMDGELGTEIAKEDFPQAKTLQLPQSADFTQLILNVTTGKADVTFLAAAPGLQYQEAHPGSIRALDPDNPARVFANAVLLPKGAQELKNSLDYVLSGMLYDGTVSSILEKYEVAPGSFLRVSPPYRLKSRE